MESEEDDDVMFVGERDSVKFKCAFDCLEGSDSFTDKFLVWNKDSLVDAPVRANYLVNTGIQTLLGNISDEATQIQAERKQLSYDDLEVFGGVANRRLEKENVSARNRKAHTNPSKAPKSAAGHAKYTKFYPEMRNCETKVTSRASKFPPIKKCDEPKKLPSNATDDNKISEPVGKIQKGLVEELASIIANILRRKNISTPTGIDILFDQPNVRMLMKIWNLLTGGKPALTFPFSELTKIIL